VELWQEDLWKEIIVALDAGHPDQVDYSAMRNFDQPAASRYAATNQDLLKWFDSYNRTVEPKERVWPFNFLLSFQPKSMVEMAAVDPEALSLPIWRRRTPHPASRYSSDLIKDQPPVFDRRTGEAVPWSWLKSYRRALVRHHLHSEMKFLGGADDQRGTLRRRRVQVWATIPIGKEADNLEEREALGEDDDAVEWSMARQDRATLAADVEDVLKTYRISDAELLRRAGVSHHTLGALRQGRRVAAQSLLSLAQAAERLRLEFETSERNQQRWLQVGQQLAEKMGSVAKLALVLGVTRQYLGRVLKGEKPLTSELADRLAKQVGSVESVTAPG
jgi:transcriptional regulator with XRE-family HTH domain